MTIDELRTYKRIVLLGYGVEGQATERFIKKYHPHAEIGIADQKDDPNYLDRQSDYDLAIRTPLLRPKYVTIPYTTATNLFFAHVNQKIIGVTGTKGKSTTVSLLHHICKEAGIPSRLLGNIGKPMLDALVEGIDPHEVIILELSSYQLEDIHYSPHIACFLNIHQELHNHDTYDEYFTAKSRITLYQTKNDHFYYNSVIPIIADLAQKTHAHIHDFAQTSLDDIATQDLPFHTHEDNIKAVLALSQHLNIHSHIYTSAIQTFVPLEHRLAKVGTYDNITFYDDSASVHPNSTLLALDALSDVDTILLGGQNRGYEFKELSQALANKKVGHIVLFPETGNLIQSELENIPDYRPEVFSTSSMKDAIEYAFLHTMPEKICLLSPGAPSYLMYSNLHERGLDFVSTIHTYAQEKGFSCENT